MYGRAIFIFGCACAVSAMAQANVTSAMTACEAIKPTVENLRLTEVNAAGAVFEAQINPHNSTTTYEFAITQQLRNPANSGNHPEPAPEGLRAVGGPIPAGAGNTKVSGTVTGLERGYVYWWEVVASNLAGETRSETKSFEYFYTGGFPYGSPGTIYTPTVSPCELEVAQQRAVTMTSAAEAERRQQARKHEEQIADEALVSYALEETALKQREEEEAREASKREEAKHPVCRVPALKGDTLAVARRALVKAHCRVGTVHRPAHHHGSLYVSAQSAKAGERLGHGAHVGLTLDARTMPKRFRTY